MNQNKIFKFRLSSSIVLMLDFIIKYYPHKFNTRSQAVRGAVVSTFNNIEKEDFGLIPEQIKNQARQDYTKIMNEVLRNAE